MSLMPLMQFHKYKCGGTFFRCHIQIVALLILVHRYARWLCHFMDAYYICYPGTALDPDSFLYCHFFECSHTESQMVTDGHNHMTLAGYERALS